MPKLLRPAITLYVLLTLLTGALYPAVVTLTAQLIFPSQANGSLITHDGRVIGSALVGQEFTSPYYFWGRPSAAAPPYNGGASSGSNLGPLHPDLHAAVRARAETLRDAQPGNDAPIPVDLVTASASGLDPHISIAAAKYQAARVAEARQLDVQQVLALVDRLGSRASLPGFQDPVVNVLQLNLALDEEAFR